MASIPTSFSTIPAYLNITDPPKKSRRIPNLDDRYAFKQHFHAPGDIFPEYPHGLLSGLGSNDHPQYLLRSGGIMYGPLYLFGLPTASNEAVNKAYVDSQRFGHIIQVNSSPLTQRTNLNFVGSALVSSDSDPLDTTTINFNSYEAKANKGLSNGYPELDPFGLIPTDQLGTGTADNTTVLKGDRTWGPMPTPTLSHSDLSDLSADDHLNYVHISNSRTIDALHTFDTTGPAFILGSTSVDILITGLNSDLLDGFDSTDFFNLSNVNFTGTLSAVLVEQGPGSTLDADTLDGYDSTDFSLSTHNHDHNSLTNLTVGDPHTLYLPVDGSRAPTSDISWGNLKITNLGSPTNSGDAVNKGYLDSRLLGLDWTDSVLSRTTSSPPLSPSVGDRYIIPVGASGAWAGQDNKITQWSGAGWIYVTPTKGTALWIEDVPNNYQFNGTSWIKFGNTLDHSSLLNLSADDHLQYLRIDGTRAMTGYLILNADPVSVLGAVTKQYCDNNSAARASHTHTQNIASDTWIINHGLESQDLTMTFLTPTGVPNKYHFLSANDVEFVDDNNIIVTFLSAFDGKVTIYADY